MRVEDLNTEGMSLVSDSQDVNALNEYLGLIDPEYDSYIVKVEDGEYTEIYGIEGIIPYLYKTVIKIK